MSEAHDDVGRYAAGSDPGSGTVDPPRRRAADGSGPVREDAGSVSDQGAPDPMTPDARGGSFGAPSVAPTRTSAVWTAAMVGTLLLLVLAIFVGQNTQRTSISFLWWHGHAPAAVLLLVASVVGAVLVIAAGGARILQLRRRTGGTTRTDRHRTLPRAEHRENDVRSAADGPTSVDPGVPERREPEVS